MAKLYNPGEEAEFVKHLTDEQKKNLMDVLQPVIRVYVSNKLITEVIAAAREIPGMRIKAGARLHPPRLVAALAALDRESIDG